MIDDWKRHLPEIVGLFFIQFVAKYQTIKGGNFGRKETIFETLLTAPKKTEMGDSLVSSGLLCFN